jgi:hypothetical protein
MQASRSVALDKESNMPDTPRLHQKKQAPLLNSTLLRHLYLKGRALPDPDLASLRASRTTLQSADARPESRHKNKDCRLM